jgi:NADH-quinone oxidoreductase subunit J
MIEQFFFLVFAVIAVVSAFFVVTMRNPVHSAVFLISTLFQVAAIFVLLRSPFLAVVQIFIYVGAVMVLFLFAVFLLDIKKATINIFSGKHMPLAYAAIICLLVESLMIVFYGGLQNLRLTEPGVEVSVETLGKVLFTSYIFPFEIVSLVLLVAMVGAIVMAREKKG